MENRKEQLKKSLEGLMNSAEFFKNLPVPENEEQQKDMDKLYDSIHELDDYLGEILGVIEKSKTNEIDEDSIEDIINNFNIKK